jgi:hypothetical protein
MVSSSGQAGRTGKSSNDTPADFDRKEVFKRHFVRFWGEVGDYVVFKRPKKHKIQWQIIAIETDPEKVTWSNGGWTPNYIHLQAELADRAGKVKTTTVWTCENQLKPVGLKGKRK